MRGIILKGSLFSLSFVLSMVAACAAADVLTVQSPNMHTHSMMAAAAKPLPPATKKPTQTVEVPPMPKSSAAAPAAGKAEPEAKEFFVKSSAELEATFKANSQKPIVALTVSFVPADPNALAGLNQLAGLNVLKFNALCRITDTMIANLGPLLSKLKEFHAPLNPLTDKSLQLLGEVAKGLTALNVGGSRTKITDAGIAALATLPLQTLNLNGSEATDVSLAVFEKMPLTELHVRGTFITKAAALKLKTTHPKLTLTTN